MLQFPYFAMVTKLQHITLTRTRSDERALSSLGFVMFCYEDY